MNSKLKIESIVFLDDLFRSDFIHNRQFIYTLISEPIKQVLQINIPDTHNYPKDRGFENKFDEQKFVELAGEGAWQDKYHGINKDAQCYLLECLTDNVLVIGYEMPIWLLDCLGMADKKIYWLNIRMSPIRFGRDLYFVLSSNLNFSKSLLNKWSVSEDEIKLEAGLIKAKVMHAQNNFYYPKPIQCGVVFIGQTEFDASLVKEDGSFARISHYEDQLKKFVNNETVYYKKHPYAISNVKTELKYIKNIFGKTPIFLTDNIYTLLASNNKLKFISISSGVLQEAVFFNKESMCLYKHICDYNKKNVLHCKFSDLISPSLWMDIFDLDFKNVNFRNPIFIENEMRHLHNAWFGYNDFLFSHDLFYKDSFNYVFKQKKHILFKKVLTLIIFMTVLIFMIFISMYVLSFFNLFKWIY